LQRAQAACLTPLLLGVGRVLSHTTASAKTGRVLCAGVPGAESAMRSCLVFTGLLKNVGVFGPQCSRRLNRPSAAKAALACYRATVSLESKISAKL